MAEDIFDGQKKQQNPASNFPWPAGAMSCEPLPQRLRQSEGQYHNHDKRYRHLSENGIKSCEHVLYKKSGLIIYNAEDSHDYAQYQHHPYPVQRHPAGYGEAEYRL